MTNKLIRTLIILAAKGMSVGQVVSPTMASAMVMNTTFTDKITKPKNMKLGNLPKAGKNARGLADWRKFAHSESISTDGINKAVPSTVEAARPKNSGLSNNNVLVIETGKPNYFAANRGTAEGVVPCKDISSSEGHKADYSPEKTLDVIHMKVTDLTSVDIVGSSGHTVTLPATFAIDVSLVERACISASGSSSLSIGEMKRATNPHHLRAAMEEADIDQTRGALRFPPAFRSVSTKSEFFCSSGDTQSNIFLKEQDTAAMMKADPAIERVGRVEARSPQHSQEVGTADRDRFQHMLDRLTRYKPLLASGLAEVDQDSNTVAGPQAGDLSITAGLVKETNVLYQQQVARQHANGHKVTGDSGYASPDVIDQGSSGSRHDLGTTERPSKKLNPLALEFEVLGETKSLVAPSRPHTSSSSLGTDIFAQYQAQQFGSTSEISPLLSNHNTTHGHGFFVPTTFPIHSGAMVPPMPSTSPPIALFNNLYGSNNMMSAMPPMNPYPDQITSALANVGTFPPSAMPTAALQAMANGFRPQSVPINGYPLNTVQTEYPRAPFQQLTMSMPMPTLPSQGYTVASQYPTTGIYGAAAGGFVPSTAVTNPPQLPLPAIKSVPHFPVTRKPRDNDPVTQQLYEAYLEYRKSFEPGFHEAARKRQMNRFARQNA